MNQSPYEINAYSDKSFVVRTNPPDFLKNYSGHLVALSGKWNPNLRYPDNTGTATRGGWIFPNTYWPQVNQLFQMIQSGQVPPAPPEPRRRGQTSPGFSPTVAPGAASSFSGIPTPSIAPSVSLLTSAAASAVPTIPRPPPSLPTMRAPPTMNPLAPVMGLPGAAPVGYQQIICTVLRPTTGSTLQLNVAGQKIPLTVESTTVEEGIVKKAVVVLPDGQRTTIELNLTGVPHWEVAGFNQAHEITI